MNLVEFLILLLEAQSQTLQRLAALFGEDILLEMLEAVGEEPALAVPKIGIEPGWFGPSATGARSPVANGRSAYAELESSVRGFKLSPVLQFHLWAYPLYREFIESDLKLDAPIAGDATALLDKTIVRAQQWIHHLPVPAEFKTQIERAANPPWVRFRSAVLKGLGQRPMGPVE